MKSNDIVFCIWLCQYFDCTDDKDCWICMKTVGPYQHNKVYNWDDIQAYFEKEIIPNMPSRKIDLNDYNIRNPEIKP